MQRQAPVDQKEYKAAYAEVSILIRSYQGHLVREFFESLSAEEEKGIPYKEMYSYQQIPTDKSKQIAECLYYPRYCYIESKQLHDKHPHDARKIFVSNNSDYSLGMGRGGVWANEDNIVRFAISNMGLGIAVPSQDIQYPNTHSAITALAWSGPYAQERRDILDKLDYINQLIIYLNHPATSQVPYEERLQTLQRLLSAMSTALAKHRNNPGLDAFLSACSILFTNVLIPFRLIYSKCRYGEYWATFFDTEGQLMQKHACKIMTEAGIPAPVEMKSALG